MHLKYSKGSRHALHLYDALQGVEPNSLTRVVSTAEQRGQDTFSPGARRLCLLALPAGGAMP